MRNMAAIIVILLSTLSAVCQSASIYELATITNVSVHEPKDNSELLSYEVTVKVNSTAYVVRYIPPHGENIVQYAAGRQLLVLVAKDTITYNDILGQSLEVPIVSRTPIEAPVVSSIAAEGAGRNRKAVQSDKRSK